MNIKGVSKRASNRYRARVTIAGTCLSKDFKTSDYVNLEDLKVDMLIWLESSRDSLKHKATGITSKYKTKVDTIQLTQEILKQYLDYNEWTGIFTWLKTEANSIKVGDTAGCYDQDGYVVITLLGKVYKAHRLAFLYMEGKLPPVTLDVDHDNRITSDNTWTNIRTATRSQNQQNAVRANSLSTSIKGLTLIQNGTRYKATVNLEGKVYTKHFPVEDKDIAIQYLQNLRIHLHKEFSNHG